MKRPADAQLSKIALAGAAVVLFATVAVHLARLFDSASVQTSEAAPAPAVSAPEARRAQRDYRALIAWHLFGEAAAEDASAGDGAAPLGPLDDVPTSALALVLTGVVAGADGSRGRAIIAAAGGPQLEYTVGDTLPGNAALRAIEPRRVIIERDGRLEALVLPEPGAGLEDAARAAGAQPNANPPANRGGAGSVASRAS
jgi:general secretion pathway protein C